MWNIAALESPQVTKNQSGANGGTSALSDDLLDAFEASLADPTEGEEGGRQISLKRHILTVKSKDLGCAFPHFAHDHVTKRRKEPSNMP